MNTDKWIWMPHAGHLAVGNECLFHLNTYLGNGYLVSTVGEWWPDEVVLRIHAQVYDPQWYTQNQQLKGDSYKQAHRNKFKYMEIGAGRIYETMVFKAIAETNAKAMCCPWTQESGDNIDFDTYNSSVAAYKGHLEMCEKWALK